MSLLVAVVLLGQKLAEAPAGPLEQVVPPPSNNYPLGPDSVSHIGVPKGTTFEFVLADSKVFPGTRRTISVYVPAEYKADRPACVYVGLDSLGSRAPTVFDNLVAQGAMPVTIGIGLSPGTVESAQAPENPRFDRSFEFDSLSDRLARFLLDDAFPAVEKRSTPDGKRILLSRNPNDRAIGAGSTGGIGAFTVAWERPDQFRRVFTAIGTFVGMRGGERYYVLVRKTEPKPLRIFMQDGANDEWTGGPEMGDWWMSNQTMARALEFAGYDVRHVWGVGTHDGRHAESIFPDAMRWLWRDWPNPVNARDPGNPVLKQVLEPGEQWQVAAQGCGELTSLATDRQGSLFVADEHSPKAIPLNLGTEAKSCPSINRSVPLAFGPDGSTYIGSTGAKALGAQLVTALNARNNHDLYLTVETDRGDGELWLVRKNGTKQRLDHGLKGPSAIVFSPDGLWLMVTQSRSRSGYSYRVRIDGTLDAREPFYAFVVPEASDQSGARGAWMDQEGRAYVATAAGVQIFDRNGRVTAILPLPNGAPATAISFGGSDFRSLNVAAGGTIYRRKLRVAGVPPWAAAIKLPPWSPG